ncbi:aminoglycoside phosphotransferase family protein [Erythrobacter sp. THAF29]|uniref:aminoglycoside phosphotransferase family protein n=1 Tax=Erythrobacter sp. THAF29 TaxID=2587851 RepID=UPI00126853CC|nr:phosphotransferase [Erythrobacter sp. THAF29]QFT77671.1 Phosphotransferase enzyme family protein [Erythrobacter sp. THAF29]
MTELPAGLHEFLSKAGWEGAEIDPIPGDASFRRYFRVRRPSGERAMLMHAPPPHEDPAPFLLVAQWLSNHGLRAPEILAQNPREGWVLTEDFGNDRMRDWLDENPDGEESAYAGAIDALVELHRQEPGPFSPYDMPTYLRETSLLTEWYAPAVGLDVDVSGYDAAWSEALEPMLARQKPGVTVLRDYHAENIMLLGDPRMGAPQGLIDFQDALVGHPAYDLVSLLQDARRDVSEDLERAMLSRYAGRAGANEHFEADYARLGAQRNAKIVGIFTRLYKRDGKPRYLDMIPRVWAAMERDLAHPALGPVADWFARNIPDDLRKSGGGTIK